MTFFEMILVGEMQSFPWYHSSPSLVMLSRTLLMSLRSNKGILLLSLDVNSTKINRKWVLFKSKISKNKTSPNSKIVKGSSTSYRLDSVSSRNENLHVV
jgi:hypothetical protein